MKKILFAFLFVLAIVPAAFAATGSMPGPVCKTDAGLYCCENATCSDLSQSQYREYKSIKGTVYSNIETREHFNGFVKLEYKPNDSTKPSKTFFIDGSFGFGIPKDAPGIITFTAWKNNKANPEYQVVRVSTDEFHDYGKDILMQKATPTTVTNTNTSTETGASSGTTGSTRASSGTRSGSTRPADPNPVAVQSTGVAGGIRISGKIVYPDGDPATGAIIKPNKDTYLFSEKNNWAESDANGHFSIQNFPRNESAIVLLMGYKDKIIPAGELKENMTITLENDTNKLKEAQTVSCTHEQLEKVPFAAEGWWKEASKAVIDVESGKVTEPARDAFCEIIRCTNGYTPSKDKKSCTPCPCGTNWIDKDNNQCNKWNPAPKCDKRTNPVLPENAKTAHMACDTSAKPEEQTYCSIDECINSLYEKKNSGNRQNAVCEAIKPDCQVTDGGKYASEAGKWELDKSGNKICVPKIVRSVEDYQNEIAELSDNAAAMHEVEDYQNEIAELSDNAAAMHEKETSLKNRIIGAVGIGATGIGGTMLGAAISETAADAAAERDMAAYLQSMHCEYGNGHNVNGGETGVELPGGNDMIALYTEYAQLANDLKIRKESLGIRPGIESEVVIDKSQTDLYEYDNNGITGGVYASIARALLDPEGEDAAMWAAQKEKTKNTLVAGAITAGVGAVGSAAANLIVNSNNKSQLDTIKRKYEKLKVPFEDLERGLANNQTERKCSDFTGATGTYPKCTCPTKQYFSSEHGCIACTGHLIVNPTNDGCTCPTGQVQEGTTCHKPKDACTITKLKKSDVCACVDSAEQVAGDCQCRKNFTENEDRSDCVRTPAEAVLPASATTAPASITIVDIQLGSDTAFASGKDTLTPTAVRRLWDFTQQAKQKIAATDSKIDLSKENDYCIFIIGKTDHQPFKNPDNDTRNNQSLSERRAKSVANYLSRTFNSANIQSYGIAATDCTPTTPVSNEKCRVVNVKMLTGSCGDNLSNSGKWIGSMVQNTAARGTAVQGLIDGFKAATSGNK